MVNGRLSQRSFTGYRRLRRFLRRVLEQVDLFLMQGDAHAARILELGAPPERVRVLGNLKFDAVDAAPTLETLARLLETPPGHPLWVAGSTMPGEEAMVLHAYRRVREKVPGAALIVAPRHPERFGEVPALVEAAGFRCLSRTGLERGAWRNGSVVLLDTLGELAQVYPLASVVFVGGSLVPAGGHNILEPAVAGKAVVVGPHMENFREITDQFRAEDAVVQIGSSEELAGAVIALLTDEARRLALGARARRVVDRNRGAVRLTVDALAGLVA
jgi:3-deoxy-D-manno-octulosonic-acid transferase